MPPRLNLFNSKNAAVSLFRLQTTSSSASASATYTVSASSRARSTIALLNSRRNQPQVQLQRRAASSTSGKDGEDGAVGGGPRAGVEGEVVGPNQDPLPDVGQEAAEIDRIVNKGGESESGSCGKGSPEFEQGTPVQEVSFFFLCWSGCGIKRCADFVMGG